MALPVLARAPVSSRIRSPVSAVRSGESELVDGRVHVVAVDEVVGRGRMFRFRGLGVVHAWFSFRCLVHEVERLDAEAGGEVEDDAAAFAAGGPSPGFDASDGLRGLSGPDGEFGLAEPLSRPVPGEAGAGPSGGRIVRGMVRFGPAGELFHAGVERDGDAGEDPGGHVRGVAFPASRIGAGSGMARSRVRRAVGSSIPVSCASSGSRWSRPLPLGASRPVRRAGLMPRVFAHCRIWSGSSVVSGVSPFSIRSMVVISMPVSRARVCSRTLSRSLIARSSAAPMGMVLPVPLICRLLSGRCRTGARVRRGRCRCRWPGWPRGCRSCSVRRVCFGRRTRRARR